MNNIMSITEAADRVGVSTRAIMRWEAAGEGRKGKKGLYRGWRVYDHDDVEELITFHDKVVKCG